MKEKNIESFSLAAVLRMPNYLRYLNELRESGVEYVSSTDIGERMGINPVLVKKDLSSVLRTDGKPKLGYAVVPLIQDIEYFLGYDDVKDVVLVGTGRLGQALMSYHGFENYGINIVVAFDSDPALIGKEINGIKIMHISKMEDLITRLRLNIGVITVPKDQAQEVADKMIRAGIKGIWNWAPVHLTVPDDVALKNEDIASSLAILSNEMKKKLKGGI